MKQVRVISGEAAYVEREANDFFAKNVGITIDYINWLQSGAGGTIVSHRITCVIEYRAKP